MGQRQPVEPVSASWHGTPGGYTNHRCACTRCLIANAKYRREYRASQRNAPVTISVRVTGIPRYEYQSKTRWSVNDVPAGATHHSMVVNVLRRIADEIAESEAAG